MTLQNDVVALQQLKFVVLPVSVYVCLSRKIVKFQHLDSAKLDIANRNPARKGKNDPLHVTVGYKVIN